MARRMTARFGGRCAADCGTRVQAGDEIVFAGPGRSFHAACFDGTGEPNGGDGDVPRRLGSAIRTLSDLEAAWAVERERNEYFDGEVEIEAAAKRRFWERHGFFRPIEDGEDDGNYCEEQMVWEEMRAERAAEARWLDDAEARAVSRERDWDNAEYARGVAHAQHISDTRRFFGESAAVAEELAWELKDPAY